MARPKSDRWAGADEAIGHACAQLLHWGLPGVEVFATVAAVAGRVFGRRIGAERVRQVYRSWALQACAFGYRAPSGITKESRSLRRPPEPIDALAERLLRDHRPGSLQQLARQRDALADAERVAGQVDLTAPAAGRDPLDDPKWFDCGAGTHPDDMTSRQRAAFEALNPHEREHYRVLVERDAKSIEADDKATRERWEQHGLRVNVTFERVKKGFEERFYALPGTAVGGAPTPVRGRVRRKIR